MGMSLGMSGLVISVRCTRARSATSTTCTARRVVAGTVEKEVANLGVVSRRQLSRMFRSGRITVDGEVVRNSKEKVSPEATLAIDGIELHRDPPSLLKFHKPFDVISSMYEKICRMPCPGSEPLGMTRRSKKCGSSWAVAPKCKR